MSRSSAWPCCMLAWHNIWFPAKMKNSGADLPLFEIRGTDAQRQSAPLVTCSEDSIRFRKDT